MTFLQILFSTKGRLSRLPYFGYSLLVGVFSATAFGAIFFLNSQHTSGGAAAASVVFIAAVFTFIWCRIALVVKRLHDLDMAGAHMIWISAIDLGVFLTVGTPHILLWLAAASIGLWVLFAPGTPGDNRFGEPRRRLAFTATVSSSAAR